MNHTVENKNGVTTLNFTLSKEEWEVFNQRAYEKNKAKINIAGFRKGHAPRHLIERLYGKGVFIDDAFDMCFKDCFSKVLDSNPEIYPVEEPKVEIGTLDGDEIKFSAAFAVKPEPVLGEYKNLKIEKVEYEVEKTDVDAELRRAAERLVRKVEKEAAENGDVVNIDYAGRVSGKLFDGGSAKGHELELGSHSFIDTFEEQLIGAKKGEERVVKVTFPAEYHAENLKGKPAEFTIKVNGVFKKEFPELNDDFAKEASRFDTMAEYRADVEKRLTETAKTREKNENENALIGKIVDGVTVEIPDAMVESELNYMLNDFAYQLMYMYNGMKLDDYFKYSGTDVNAYKAARRDEAKRNVKTRLTLEKIIKSENIEITEQEVQNEIAAEAEKAHKTPEEFASSLDDGRFSYIKNSLLSKKLVEFLTANNTFSKTTAAKKTEKTEKTTKTAAKKTEKTTEKATAPAEEQA